MKNEKIKLGKVCQFKNGNGFKEIYQGNRKGQHPFIKVSDMNLPENKKYIAESKNWVSTETIKKLKATLHPTGATVFAKVGVALKLNRRRILSRPTVIDNNMMSAIPNENIIDRYFLFYFLQTQDLGRYAQEGAVPSINHQHLYAISIYLPSTKEQKRIVTTLEIWDDAIDKTEKLITAKQKQFEWLVIILMSHKKYWKVSKLNDFFTEKTEFHKTGNYTVASVGIHGIRKRSDIYSKELSSNYYNNKIIKNACIVFGLANKQIVYGVNTTNEIYSVSPAYKIYEISDIHLTFINFYMRAYNKLLSNKFLITSARQGKNIDFKGLLNYKISLPDITEQESIAQILNTAQNEITLLKQQAEKYRAQKRGLMKKLLSKKGNNE